MRTTKRELLKMLEKYSDNAQIILHVRGNKTTDYSEQRIKITDDGYGDIIFIKDKLSI